METSARRINKPNTDGTWDDKAVDPAECGMIGALMNMSLHLFPKTRQSLQTMDGTRWSVHADEFSRNYVSLGFLDKLLEASTGALDQALDGCQSLRDDVVILMYQIVEALYQGLTRFGQLDSMYSKEVDSLLEKAEASLKEDGGNSSVDRESFNDIIEDITSCVNALDDLAATLEHPVPDTTVQPELARPADLLNEQDPMELFFEFIQHRFPEASDQTINQHAHANFSRMLRLQQLRAATAIKSKDDVKLHQRDAGGSIAATKRTKDSGLGSSIGESSASIVSAIRKRNYNEMLPKLPDAALSGEPFVCDFCQHAVQFRDNAAWNQHLFKDVQPWVCIDPDCISSKELFNDRKTWISHLVTHIPSMTVGSPFICPLCRKVESIVHDEIIGHFEQHLLQIALIVAPLGDNLEDESDPEDETIGMTAGHRNHPSANTSWKHAIHINNLGPEVTQSSLLDTFRHKYNSAKSAVVPCDPISGLPSGYGSVWFADELDRDRAFRGMQGAYCGKQQMLLFLMDSNLDENYVTKPVNTVTTEEDVIRCLCGHGQDDGNTVLCEQCDTWQHILCYYDGTMSVPKVHKFVECEPRPLDILESRQALEKDGQAAPPGRCHSCNRTKIPLWRRGPDGARTLCNACGLNYANLTRKMRTNKSSVGSSKLRPTSVGPDSPGPGSDPLTIPDTFYGDYQPLKEPWASVSYNPGSAQPIDSSRLSVKDILRPWSVEDMLKVKAEIEERDRRHPPKPGEMSLHAQPGMFTEDLNASVRTSEVSRSTRKDVPDTFPTQFVDSDPNSLQYALGTEEQVRDLNQYDRDRFPADGQPSAKRFFAQSLSDEQRRLLKDHGQLTAHAHNAAIIESSTGHMGRQYDGYSPFSTLPLEEVYSYQTKYQQIEKDIIASPPIPQAIDSMFTLRDHSRVPQRKRKEKEGSESGDIGAPETSVTGVWLDTDEEQP